MDVFAFREELVAVASVDLDAMPEQELIRHKPFLQWIR